MPLHETVRKELQKAVTRVRAILTEDFTLQCKTIYGIQPDGTFVDLALLGHLSEEEKTRAHVLRDRIAHLASTSKDNDPIGDSVDRMLREQAFTTLNRLCALRMCEERSLVLECVRRGVESKGFQLYEEYAAQLGGDTASRYQLYLSLLWDELSVELGVLFDRFAASAVLFPSPTALRKVLEELNRDALRDVWADDETIGWVYQYFNPPEERKAMREASQAPRSSRELAVRNQFFTPRYVVEFLTDNTLGRIWYEMRKGDTVLKDECRYLVRRPTEVFLAQGETPPVGKKDEVCDSQEELLMLPAFIEHRPKKDPRDLRILDPSCGSGHFLLYSFDLLERLYEEAWADAESPNSDVTGNTLRVDFRTLEHLRRESPRLIVEHNLHGIDIDPRASQIAALALWLRAQKTWNTQRLKPKERPRIARANIATAEPMPSETIMLRELMADLKPPVLVQLLQVVCDKMTHAGKLGSLLNIEQEIENSISEARKQWIEGPRVEQAELFPELVKGIPEQQQLRFDLAEVNDEYFWEKVEGRILRTLKEYAATAESVNGNRRRLFASDAGRGFAFIDLCRRRYDVVLMNPPFGEAPSEAKTYLSRAFPQWNENLLCAFIERAWQMSNDGGCVAAIYDRTAAVKSTYEGFRRTHMVPDDRLTAMADLGWGVLDANVEVTTCVLHKAAPKTQALFIDIRALSSDKKPTTIADRLSAAREGRIKDGLWLARSRSFWTLPNAVIGYDFPSFLRLAFSNHKSLEATGYKAHQGFALKADKHFRLWWEIGNRKQPIVNWMFNGASYSPYLAALRDVAVSVVQPEDLPMDSSTRKSGLGLHRKPGVCFGKRGEYFCAQMLPSGFIFTVEGQSIPIADSDRALEVLGLLNTPLVRFSLNKYCGLHKYSGYVNLLPLRIPADRALVRKLVMDAVLASRRAQEWDETQLSFGCSWKQISLARHGELVAELVNDASNTSLVTEERIHQLIVKAYEVGQTEMQLLESFRKREPRPESPIEDAVSTDRCQWFISHSLLSQSVGAVFGRWDVRLLLDRSLIPNWVDVFATPQQNPPASLVSAGGRPAEPDRIVSDEWLRARRDCGTLPPEGSVKDLMIPDSKYPLVISWNGVLVDDPGMNGDRPHRHDIVRRVRDVFDLLSNEKAHEIEREACDILSVSDLRDYFRRPAGFFQDHLKRYTKSRRKAPIYWPLSTDGACQRL